MTVTTTKTSYYRPVITHDHSVTGQGFVEGDTYLGTNLTMTKTKSSVENPRWKSQVKRHTQAGTQREITEHSVRGGQGVLAADWWRTSGGVVVENYVHESGHIIYPPSLASVPSFNSAADNQARMKFYKRAKDAQTAFRGLTALGELRETLGMLRNPGRALRRGLDDYVTAVNKRSRRAKRSSLNRIVSETWLEHVFGWQPLISDVKSAGDALNRRLDRFMGNYTRISGTGGAEPVTTFGTGFKTRHVMRVFYFTLQKDISSVRYYGQVRSVCENPLQADLQLFGVNWREVVPTAWELIPYSFLVDYFSNIGDVLDAWSIRKSDIAWASSSIKRSREITYSRPYIIKSYTESVATVLGWRGAYVSVSPLEVVAKQINRSAHTPALPSIQMEIPGLGTKWINMTALLAARNRTRRQLFR